MKKSLLLAALLMAGGAAFAQKLSPNTLMTLNERSHRSNHSFLKSVAGPAEEGSINAYVKINSQSVIAEIEALGGTIHTNLGGNLVTVNLPIATLYQVADLDDVVYIEAAKPVNLLMNNASTDAGVDKCHTATAGMEAFTGKGVVVGIVDCGLEYNHIDYMDSEGKESRLRRIWCQGKSKGDHPAAYDYGVEYTSADQFRTLSTDSTATFHASHVMGIAAGADQQSGYAGVAPDADLVFVSMGKNSTSIVDGVKYIFDYAKSVGKPCVVNLSLGSHYGPHDGTSVTDRMFDKLVSPGYIIVGAAGNEGAYNAHVTKTMSSDTEDMKFIVNNPVDTKDKKLAIDIWGAAGTSLTCKFVLINTINGKIMAESESVSPGMMNDVKNINLQRSRIKCELAVYSQINPINLKPEITVVSTGTSSSAYKLGVILTSEEGAQIHAWQLVQGDSFMATHLEGWTSPDNDYVVGEIGGTGNSVITVGAYTTRMQWTDLTGKGHRYGSIAGQLNGLSGFSSCGPTVDGRCKPDITAPGCGVVSAMSKYSNEDVTEKLVAQRTVKGKKYYYGVCEGTSMATPFVTGTIALWLQADPTLTVDGIRNIFAETARRDAFVGNVPNNAWGAGKIDAYEGLKYVLNHAGTGISEKDLTGAMFQVEADRVAHTATIGFEENGTPVHLTVYNALGQLLTSQELTVNGTQVDLSGFGSGMFVFKMQRGSNVKSVKMAL